MAISCQDGWDDGGNSVAIIDTTNDALWNRRADRKCPRAYSVGLVVSRAAMVGTLRVRHGGMVHRIALAAGTLALPVAQAGARAVQVVGARCGPIGRVHLGAG